MSLVDYSDSDDDEVVSETAISSNSRHNVLPDHFFNIYTDGPALSSSYHEFQRNEPHQEGKYPSQIYIEYLPSILERHEMTSYLESIGLARHSLLLSNLDVPQTVHLSFTFNTAFIDSKDVKDFVEDLRLTCSEVSSFTLETDGKPKVFESASKKFLVVGLNHDADSRELKSLLSSIERISQRYGFRSYHDIVSLHISIASWSRGDSDLVDKSFDGVPDCSSWKWTVNKLKVKCGHTVTELKLSW